VARFDLDRSDLTSRLSTQPSYRVDQVWQGLHAGREIEDLTSLPASLRAELTADPAFAPSLRMVHEATGDQGETVKWLFEVEGGARIETVLMHHSRRTTVCVSSQAGCAMACGFCATGQAGFDRHLSVGEIVEQVVRAQVASSEVGRRLSNVVFMGMGEPFANYDRVWAAVSRIHSELGLSARHITLSTVGVVPGIDRLAGEQLPVSLAVSLHAASDSLRDELVPLNRRYPLAAVAEACARYLDAGGRRLSFEWALIRDVNDSDEQAELLAAYARQFRLAAHVNLIPLNPTDGFATPGSAPDRVRAFRDVLRSLGVNVTVRRTRGVDIDAACGQLRARVRG
jgi:23S rRNA (adenine2503-C2)-methyltransferase